MAGIQWGRIGNLFDPAGTIIKKATGSDIGHKISDPIGIHTYGEGAGKDVWAKKKPKSPDPNVAKRAAEKAASVKKLKDYKKLRGKTTILSSSDKFG